MTEIYDIIKPSKAFYYENETMARRENNTIEILLIEIYDISLMSIKQWNTTAYIQ